MKVDQTTISGPSQGVNPRIGMRKKLNNYLNSLEAGADASKKQTRRNDLRIELIEANRTITMMDKAVANLGGQIAAKDQEIMRLHETLRLFGSPPLSIADNARQTLESKKTATVDEQTTKP